MAAWRAATATPPPRTRLCCALPRSAALRPRRLTSPAPSLAAEQSRGRVLRGQDRAGARRRAHHRRPAQGGRPISRRAFSAARRRASLRSSPIRQNAPYTLFASVPPARRRTMPPCRPPSARIALPLLTTTSMACEHGRPRRRPTERAGGDGGRREQVSVIVRAGDGLRRSHALGAAAQTWSSIPRLIVCASVECVSPHSSGLALERVAFVLSLLAV